MGTRLNAVREACKLDPELRSEDNINDIVDFVKDVKFFTKLTSLQQRALCRTMTLEEFGARDFIFKNGEYGDKFYIILTGNVGVHIPALDACPNGIHNGDEECDCPVKTKETIVFLERGMGFGELALQSDQPRSATIACTEATETLVTKRADYEQYAGHLHRLFIGQRVKFLRRFPRIEDSLQRCLVSTQDIAALANCLSERSLSGNELVVRQGEPVEHMIFVRSGQLAMLRTVESDASQESGPATGQSSQAKKDTASDAGAQLDLGADSSDETASVARRGGFSHSLARAMLEMKRKERSDRLTQMHETTDASKAVVEASAGTDASGHAVAKKRGGSKCSKQSSDAGGSEGPLKHAGKRASKALDVPALAAGSPESTRSKERWNMLKSSVNKAGALKRVMVSLSTTETTSDVIPGEEAAKRNVEHFASVSAARRRVAQYAYKEIAQIPLSGREKRQSTKAARRDEEVERAVPEKEHSQMRRKRVLSVGSVGAFQYFGDRQVCNGETYPVTLVSDPVAELYMMSKHDILRRLPKKLFNALFAPDGEAVPTDQQCMDMLRQTERWTSFRRTAHSQAASRRHEVMQTRLPARKAIALTAKDEEYFSQSSARFLRKFELMKQDKDLQKAFAAKGLRSRQQVGGGGSLFDDDDVDDPNRFEFEQSWARCGKFPGLDLDDEQSEFAKAPPESARHSVTAGRASSGRTMPADVAQASRAITSRDKLSGGVTVGRIQSRQSSLAQHSSRQAGNCVASGISNAIGSTVQVVVEGVQEAKVVAGVVIPLDSSSASPWSPTRKTVIFSD